MELEKTSLDEKQKHLARLKKQLAKQEKKLKKSFRSSKAKDHVRKKLQEQALIESREKETKKHRDSCDSHLKEHYANLKKLPTKTSTENSPTTPVLSLNISDSLIDHEDHHQSFTEDASKEIEHKQDDSNANTARSSYEECHNSKPVPSINKLSDLKCRSHIDLSSSTLKDESSDKNNEVRVTPTSVQSKEGSLNLKYTPVSNKTKKDNQNYSGNLVSKSNNSSFHPKDTKNQTSTISESSEPDDSSISQTSAEISRTSYFNDSISLTPTFSAATAAENNSKTHNRKLARKKPNARQIPNEIDSQAYEIPFTNAVTETFAKNYSLHSFKDKHSAIVHSLTKTSDTLSRRKQSLKALHFKNDSKFFPSESKTEQQDKGTKCDDEIHFSEVELTTKTYIRSQDKRYHIDDDIHFSEVDSMAKTCTRQTDKQTKCDDDIHFSEVEVMAKAFPQQQNKLQKVHDPTKINTHSDDFKLYEDDLNFRTCSRNEPILPVLRKMSVNSNSLKNKQRSDLQKDLSQVADTILGETDNSVNEDISNIISDTDSQTSVSILVDKSHNSTLMVEKCPSSLSESDEDLEIIIKSPVQKLSPFARVNGLMSFRRKSVKDASPLIAESEIQKINPGVAPIGSATAPSANTLNLRVQDVAKTKETTTNASNVLTITPGSATSTPTSIDFSSQNSNELSLKRKKFKHKKRKINSNTLQESDKKRTKISETHSQRSNFSEMKNETIISTVTNLDLKNSFSTNSSISQSSSQADVKSFTHGDSKLLDANTRVFDTSVETAINFVENDNKQESKYSEYTELDVVEFSHFKFSEEFLSENNTISQGRSKRKRHPSHLGMIVQRRSPRVLSATNSESTSSNSYSERSTRIRSTKQDKCLRISSVFQFLIDNAKRKTEAIAFVLPEVTFKDLIELKLLENNFDENSAASSDHNLTKKVCSKKQEKRAHYGTPLDSINFPRDECTSTGSPLASTGLPPGHALKSNRNAQGTSHENSSECAINSIQGSSREISEHNLDKPDGSPGSADNKTSDKAQTSKYTALCDINVVYDSEPIPDDSMSEEKCYQRNDAMESQEIDISVISERDPEKQTVSEISELKDEDVGKNLVSQISENKDQTLDSVQEKENRFEKISVDLKSVSNTYFDPISTERDSNILSELNCVKALNVIAAARKPYTFDNVTSTPKSSSMKLETETMKLLNPLKLESATPNPSLSQLKIETSTPLQTTNRSKLQDLYTTPKDCNIRRHFNFIDAETSPTLFNTQKEETPNKPQSGSKKLLDDDDSVDYTEQGIDDVFCINTIEPIDCLKLCRAECVVFVSGGKWMDGGEEQSYLVSLLPSALSVWSKGQGQWENELDWFLSPNYMAIDGWIIKKQNKIALIVMEEDKDGDQRLSLFFYDLTSGDSNMAPIDTQSSSDKPVTSLLCCIVNSDQIIVGYNHPTSFSATRHVLINGYKQMVLCCHLEQTTGYLMDLQEVRHLEFCLMGLTSKRDVLIWNHEEGYLLKKINVSDVITPGVTLTSVQQIQGYLLLHLMYRVKNDSPGYVVIINPSSDTSLILHDYHTLPHTWKGLRSIDICKDIQVGVDIHGNTGLWDMSSGALLVDLPKSKVTYAGIDQSDNTLYFGLDCGVLQIYDQNFNDL